MVSLSDRQRFSPLAQLFHWTTAALIVFQIPLAYYMIGLPLSPDKLASYALHKSIGLTVFSLTALRLAWRWIKPPPPRIEGASPLQHGLSQAVHFALYALLFSLPLTGWLSSSAANFPVSLFSLVTLPDLVAPNRELHDALELTHRILAYSLMTLIVGHTAAACWHQWIKRDRLLQRMLPWVRAERE